MARRSLIQRSEIDQVLKAHNCQANQKHRLTSGELRLKVYEDRSHVHYCADCAVKILEADIGKLQELLRLIRG